MLVVMGVSFFTSRIVLQALGETDYGIYNVVGGVVTILSFLNGSLAASTSRFLTYELGRQNEIKLADTFSAALNLHIFAAFLIVVFGETIGLWFLENKMTIPVSQKEAAFWVYQFSIVTSCLSFTQVPYNASIISHENMSIFAYVGLYESFAKLGIAYLIMISDSNRLIWYGALIMLNSVLVQVFYRLYTYRHYSECRFRLVKDKKLYRSLLGYSGWDLFGNLAVVCQNQGVNIVLNIFFGPVVNAARAIAWQIQGALRSFVTNFLTAVRPRVVKLYAEGNYNSMFSLTFYSCKIAYFLMFALVMPIAFEMNFILHIWLGDEVPAYTAVFAWIILAIALLDSFHSAYLMAYHAVGKIKQGNLICGSLMILCLPIGYAVLKAGMPPYSIFIVLLLVNSLCHIISWIILYRLCQFNIGTLLRDVYGRTIIVSIGAIITPFLIISQMHDGWLRLIILTIAYETIFLTLAYCVGFDKQEKNVLIKPILNKLKRKLR